VKHRHDHGAANHAVLPDATLTAVLILHAASRRLVPEVSKIEFRAISHGRQVLVDVPRETVNRHFGVPDSRYGLLEACEAHRDQIDAAVLRRVTKGGIGVVDVRPMDVH